MDIVDSSGGRRRVPDPCFHGGPGATLEMRLFSLSGILRCLGAAVFTSARVLRDDVEEFGIVHHSQMSPPLLARR